MFTEFEVYEVYTDKVGEIEDTEFATSIRIDPESEDLYDTVVEELNSNGVVVHHTWDIINDKEMGMIHIYDTKGKYRYQIKEAL